MKVRGDFLGPPRSTDKTTLIIKVIRLQTLILTHLLSAILMAIIFSILSGAVSIEKNTSPAYLLACLKRKLRHYCMRLIMFHARMI